MKTTLAITSILILAACSSPPRPAVLDGTARVPINEPAQRDAYGRMVYGAEAARLKEAKSLLPAMVSVPFGFSSSNFSPSESVVERLNALIATGARIEVRGRTDASKPNAADEGVAKARAMAAQRYLLNMGANPQQISINFLSAGDHIADNKSKAGRAQNRRVEIEFFKY